MKLLLNVIGVIAGLAVVTMFIAALWLEDGRWGGTGIIVFWLAFAAFAVASFLPKAVPHADRCSGC